MSALMSLERHLPAVLSAPETASLAVKLPRAHSSFVLVPPPKPPQLVRLVGKRDNNHRRARIPTTPATTFQVIDIMQKSKFPAGFFGHFSDIYLPQTGRSPILGAIPPKVWNRHFLGSSLAGFDGETIAVRAVITPWHVAGNRSQRRSALKA